jgi:hypothetical protein
VIDLPKPLKEHLLEYKLVESIVTFAVHEHFKLPQYLHESVHRADVAVMLAEKEQLHLPSPKPWFETDIEPAPIGELQCHSPREAKFLFLQRYLYLTGRLSHEYDDEGVHE